LRHPRTTFIARAVGHDHHHQVLAINKIHPKGGDWAAHQAWMAEQD